MSILHILIVSMFMTSTAYSIVLMYALANARDVGTYHLFVESAAFKRMDLTKTVAHEFSIYFFFLFSLIAGIQKDGDTFASRALEWIAVNALCFHICSVFASGIRAPFLSSLAIHAALLMCVLRLYV